MRASRLLSIQMLLETRGRMSAQALADAILENAHVVVEAGSFYGPVGEKHLRVCFGSETTPRIQEAMVRMARFLNTL